MEWNVKTWNQEQSELWKLNWNITVNSEGGIWADDIRQEHECYLQTVQTVTDT